MYSCLIRKDQKEREREKKKKVRSAEPGGCLRVATHRARRLRLIIIYSQILLLQPLRIIFTKVLPKLFSQSSTINFILWQSGLPTSRHLAHPACALDQSDQDPSARSAQHPPVPIAALRHHFLVSWKRIKSCTETNTSQRKLSKAAIHHSSTSISRPGSTAPGIFCMRACRKVAAADGSNSQAHTWERSLPSVSLPV